MNRRSLLAGVGCSTFAFAGCLAVSNAAIGEGDEDEEPPEPPDDPDEPIARSVVGSPSAEEPPHRVRLWNFSDERREIGLEIDSDSDSERVSYDGRYDLGPEAHVVAVLHGRDRYEATVTVDDDEAEPVEIEAASFDDPCPATELFVLEDGDLESTTDEEADHCDERSDLDAFPF